MEVTLENVMTAMGITGDYQTDTIRPYFNITLGLVTRGTSDLWNYGGGDGVLSPYFYQRAAQLAYK